MVETVRAKLRVSHISPSADGKAGTVYLHAGHGPGNEDWAAATPAAQLTMILENADALAFFEPGADVYIDFTKA